MQLSWLQTLHSDLMQPLQSSSALSVAFPAQALGMLSVRHQDGAACGALSAALLWPETVLDQYNHG